MTNAGAAAGFGAWPYLVVGLLIRLMTFTVAYQTMAVTMTVETNQTSNQVMPPFYICLVMGSLRYTLAFQQHRRRHKGLL